jgi:hypothetical protein
MTRKKNYLKTRKRKRNNLSTELTKKNLNIKSSNRTLINKITKHLKKSKIRQVTEAFQKERKSKSRNKDYKK